MTLESVDSISTRRSPTSTAWPSTTETLLTLPRTGERTAYSIFMHSTIATVVPTSTSVSTAIDRVTTPTSADTTFSVLASLIAKA